VRLRFILLFAFFVLGECLTETAGEVVLVRTHIIKIVGVAEKMRTTQEAKKSRD
jgi:hypothetical protein